MLVRNAALMLGLAAATSCTNAQLAPIPPPEVARADNKLAVDGRFCTTDPDDLAFPVKLLFLIDTSSSMDAGVLRGLPLKSGSVLPIRFLTA